MLAWKAKEVSLVTSVGYIQSSHVIHILFMNTPGNVKQKIF